MQSVNNQETKSHKLLNDQKVRRVARRENGSWRHGRRPPVAFRLVSLQECRMEEEGENLRRSTQRSVKNWRYDLKFKEVLTFNAPNFIQWCLPSWNTRCKHFVINQISYSHLPYSARRFFNACLFFIFLCSQRFFIFFVPITGQKMLRWRCSYHISRSWEWFLY